MHVRLVKTFGFEAAHWLPTFPEGHKCRRMHGHSFRVDVAVEGEVPPEKGFLVDPAEALPRGHDVPLHAPPLQLAEGVDGSGELRRGHGHLILRLEREAPQAP